jgi:hypothetical protein
VSEREGVQQWEDKGGRAEGGRGVKRERKGGKRMRGREKGMGEFESALCVKLVGGRGERERGPEEERERERERGGEEEGEVAPVSEVTYVRRRGDRDDRERERESGKGGRENDGGCAGAERAQRTANRRRFADTFFCFKDSTFDYIKLRVKNSEQFLSTVIIVRHRIRFCYLWKQKVVDLFYFLHYM